MKRTCDNYYAVLFLAIWVRRAASGSMVVPSGPSVPPTTTTNATATTATSWSLLRRRDLTGRALNAVVQEGDKDKEELEDMDKDDQDRPRRHRPQRRLQGLLCSALNNQFANTNVTCSCSTSLFEGFMGFECSATQPSCRPSDMTGLDLCSVPVYRGTVQLSPKDRSFTTSGGICLSQNTVAGLHGNGMDVGDFCLDMTLAVGPGTTGVTGCQATFRNATCKSCIPCDLQRGIQIDCVHGPPLCIPLGFPTRTRDQRRHWIKMFPLEQVLSVSKLLSSGDTNSNNNDDDNNNNIMYSENSIQIDYSTQVPTKAPVTMMTTTTLGGSGGSGDSSGGGGPSAPDGSAEQPTLATPMAPPVPVDYSLSVPTKAPTIEYNTPAPTKATLAPIKATSSPTQATLAPTKATLAPIKATSSPTQATLAPTKATLAPIKATSSPTIATLAPTKATLAPIKATSSPTRATSAPTRETSVPTKVPTILPNAEVGVLFALGSNNTE